MIISQTIFGFSDCDLGGKISNVTKNEENAWEEEAASQEAYSYIQKEDEEVEAMKERLMEQDREIKKLKAENARLAQVLK